MEGSGKHQACCRSPAPPPKRPLDSHTSSGVLGQWLRGQMTQRERSRKGQMRWVTDGTGAASAPQTCPFHLVLLNSDKSPLRGPTRSPHVGPWDGGQGQMNLVCGVLLPMAAQRSWGRYCCPWLLRATPSSELLDGAQGLAWPPWL